MARVLARITMNHRILPCDSREIEFSDDHAAINLSDTVFEFLNEEGLSPVSVDGKNEDDGEDEEEKSGDENSVNSSFWETQYQLLQVSLYALRRITLHVIRYRCNGKLVMLFVINIQYQYDLLGRSTESVFS